MEAEYEHECSRAELLGIPRPTWEEFCNSRSATTSEGNEANEDMVEPTTTEEEQNVDARKEGYRRIAGGLDELNSILVNTQKKLNRFKTVCGSFGNMIKIHMTTKKDGEATTESENKGGEPEGDGDMSEAAATAEEGSTPVHIARGNALDKLDSLIGKAEKAEMSLSSQNKQMKKFLN